MTIAWYFTLSLQWKDVSSEIKEIKRDFSKKTELGKRRTKINYDTEIIDVDLNFSEPPEPITVILSQEGWIKTLKGVDHNISEIKLKDVERVLYFENFIVIEPGLTGLKKNQLLGEEVYLQMVNAWPKTSGPVKGLVVPKQDYREQVPQQ